MEQLSIVVAGNTNCGKKTLIEQLLGKTGNQTNQPPVNNFPKKLEPDVNQITKDEFTDIPQCVLETLERSYLFFIPKDYIEFLQNAVTGKIIADAAILVIDASENIHKQVYQYTYLLAMLGVKQTIVVINKMDLTCYNKIKFWQHFEEISDFLKKLDIQIVAVIPVSAKDDDNINTASYRMNWNTTATLLESLAHFSSPGNLSQLPLRVIVHSCYLTDSKTKILAKVTSGKLFHNHELAFGPVHHTTKVLSIEDLSGNEKTFALPYESVALILEDTNYVSRGQVGFNVCQPPLITDLLTTELFWIGDKSLKPEDRIHISCGTDCCSARIEKISDIRDPSCLELKLNNVEQLAQSQFADVRIKLNSKICIDPFSKLPDLGRFAVFQDNKIAGGGILK